MKEMKYYCVRHNGDIASVYRIFENAEGMYPERWDPETKEWVFGGASNLEETTEREVMDFIQIHSL
jgi:hypothetical protein